MNRTMMATGLLLMMMSAAHWGMESVKRQEDGRETALLLIDIQDFYFPGGSHPLEEPGEAVLRARKLLQFFRSRHHTIIHVRHQAAEGGGIHQKVKPREGERVFTKRYANAFRDTGLLRYLREEGIERLVICGMMTHMCVEAAVRAAGDFGFECLLVEDACATRDLTYGDHTIGARDVHLATLAALSGTYATVTETAALIVENDE